MVIFMPAGTVVPSSSLVAPGGSQGIPGARGAKWFTGAGAPPDPIPGSQPGDMYLDTTTGDVYQVS